MKINIGQSICAHCPGPGGHPRFIGRMV